MLRYETKIGKFNLQEKFLPLISFYFWTRQFSTTMMIIFFFKHKICHFFLCYHFLILFIVLCSCISFQIKTYIALQVSSHFDFFFISSATSLGKKHRNYMYVFLIHVRPMQLHKNGTNIVLVDKRNSGFF